MTFQNFRTEKFWGEKKKQKTTITKRKLYLIDTYTIKWVPWGI